MRRSGVPKKSDGLLSRSRCHRNRTDENTSWRTIMQANTGPLAAYTFCASAANCCDERTVVWPASVCCTVPIVRPPPAYASAIICA